MENRYSSFGDDDENKRLVFRGGTTTTKIGVRGARLKRGDGIVTCWVFVLGRREVTLDLVSPLYRDRSTSDFVVGGISVIEMVMSE